MKKALSIAVCLLLVFSVLSGLSVAGAAAQPAAAQPLQFGADGQFKILQLSDIQTWFPVMRADKLILRTAIEAEQPDLIVLTGDQLWGDSTPGDWYVKGAIRGFMDVFEQYGIPVAMVYGNHDAPEGDIAQKQMMMEVYSSYDCFVGSAGECFDFRIGNYNLPILSSDGSRTAFNLYMVDSGRDNFETGDGSQDGYACILPQQVEWYVRTSNALKQANGGQPVPSINFQHIIVPEVFDVLTETPDGWVLPQGAEGVIGETPCPPNHTHGQFDAFVAQGDVLATVSGHDHVNSFVVTNQGVDIINTQNCGFATYCDENVGYRVITLSEEDLWSYETYTRTYYEIFQDDPRAQLRYRAHTESIPGFFPRLLNWNWVRYNWDYALAQVLAGAAVVTGLVLLCKRIARGIRQKKKARAGK